MIRSALQVNRAHYENNKFFHFRTTRHNGEVLDWVTVVPHLPFVEGTGHIQTIGSLLVQGLSVDFPSQTSVVSKVDPLPGVRVNDGAPHVVRTEKLRSGHFHFQVAAVMTLRLACMNLVHVEEGVHNVRHCRISESVFLLGAVPFGDPNLWPLDLHARTGLENVAVGLDVSEQVIVVLHLLDKVRRIVSVEMANNGI